MASPIQLSDSQIKTYQRCARLWGYQKLLNLQTTDNKDAMHLGNAAHDGMEQYIKTRDMTKAVEAVMAALNKDKPTNIEYCKMLIPAMLVGWASFWLPDFDKEYEFIGLEEWFDCFPNKDVLHLRGFKDVVARKRSTGERCVFDYKTASDSYFRDLAGSLSSNNQLARYATSDYRLTGRWPGETGLVFLCKPRANEDITKACVKLRTDPNMYKMLKQPVTPEFAEFALSVERNDVVMAAQMQWYRDEVAKHGPRAMDYVPANLDACDNYGTKCSFAAGCHIGRPVHQALANKP